MMNTLVLDREEQGDEIWYVRTWYFSRSWRIFANCQLVERYLALDQIWMRIIETSISRFVDCNFARMEESSDEYED